MIMADTASSEDFRADIGRAVSILKSAGCSEVYVFGSAAEGVVREESDIDLAVKGCPRGRFFYLLGRLLMELNRSVDLVDLDAGDSFVRHLQTEETLVRVG